MNDKWRIFGVDAPPTDAEQFDGKVWGYADGSRNCYIADVDELDDGDIWYPMHAPPRPPNNAPLLKIAVETRKRIAKARAERKTRLTKRAQT